MSIQTAPVDDDYIQGIGRHSVNKTLLDTIDFALRQYGEKATTNKAITNAVDWLNSQQDGSYTLAESLTEVDDNIELQNHLVHDSEKDYNPVRKIQQLFAALMIIDRMLSANLFQDRLLFKQARELVSSFNDAIEQIPHSDYIIMTIDEYLWRQSSLATNFSLSPGIIPVIPPTNINRLKQFPSVSALADIGNVLICLIFDNGNSELARNQTEYSMTLLLATVKKIEIISLPS